MFREMLKTVSEIPEHLFTWFQENPFTFVLILFLLVALLNYLIITLRVEECIEVFEYSRDQCEFIVWNRSW